MASSKTKAVDTKLLVTLVSDFSKVYNLDVTDKEANLGKQEIEKGLKKKIEAELNKYEY